jgi:hypothetical protein
VSNFEASDDGRQSVIGITHAPPSLALDTRAPGEARRGGAKKGSKQACRAFLATKRIHLFASVFFFFSFSLFDFTYLPLLSFPFLALHLSLLRIVSWFFFLVCSYFAMKPLESFFQGFVVFTISRN